MLLNRIFIHLFTLSLCLLGGNYNYKKMKKIGKFFLAALFVLQFSASNLFAQGTPGEPGLDCSSAGPFCSDDPSYTFPAGVGSGSFGSGVGCLGSTPNPAWYVMQVGQTGRINIHMATNPLEDIDFACWGPFNDATSGCGQLLLNCNGCSSHGPSNGANPSDLGGYPVGNLVDCSFSAEDEEYVHIPNALPGQWYLLLVTNYSNSPCNINIGSDPTSTGQTNCGIMTPPPIGDTVCVGETAQLNVSNPVTGATYTWEGPNDFYLNTAATSITFQNATTAMAGQYSLTIALNGNVGDPIFCSLVVNSKPTLSINTDSICLGQSAVLTVSGASTYHWSTNEYTQSITVSPTVTTPYSVIGTSVWGCKDSAQTQVVVFNNPNITVTPNVVCSGELATAVAPNAIGYSWSDGVTISDTIRPVITTSQTYTVTVTMNGGCTGTGTLTANPNPIVTAVSTEICQGESSTLTASGATNYQWSNGSTGAVVSASPFNTMSVSVIGSTDGCEGYDTTTIIVHPRPAADFVPSANSITIDDGDITFNDLSTNANSWYYNFGEFHNPSNTSTEQNPTHTYISTGYFQVWQVVTSDFGCTDSTYKRVQVEAPYFFYVPSAFTPDNDGKNEEFCPKGKGLDYSHYTMEIYDRWGNLLFKTNVPLACWDGKINGEKAPMGEYLYKINLKDMEAKYHEYLGNFTILR